jgi:hypothetical protein
MNLDNFFNYKSGNDLVLVVGINTLFLVFMNECSFKTMTEYIEWLLEDPENI